MNDTKPRKLCNDGFAVFCSHDEIVELDTLIENPKNPNKHPEAQIELLAKIIKGSGWRAPITISKRSGFIVRGHARRVAAYKAGAKYAPVEYQDYESEAAEYADLIADNRIAEISVLNTDILRDILVDIKDQDYDLTLTGFNEELLADIMLDDVDSENIKKEAAEGLKEECEIQPFSILDTRTAYWLKRKSHWKDVGIASEMGRGNDDDKSSNGLVFSGSCQPMSTYNKKNKYEKKIGAKITWQEYAELFPDNISLSGTSIFDPVLCETLYTWFCPKGGKILDPFAGGSVRGIVAAALGYNYTGVDLSSRQIEANVANCDQLIADGNVKISSDKKPNWIVGDSTQIDTLVAGKNFNLVFSCPPYADLEVYSDDQRDISNMPYKDFLAAYNVIVEKTCAKLSDNSFAIFVVSEVRGDDGAYYNLVSDTIKAFIDCGLAYYNEAVLINSFVSAALRKNKNFRQRKLVKVHQNVLVFVKGNSRFAAEKIIRAAGDRDEEEATPPGREPTFNRD
jgi:16S rRNA G966 N2-methylase RsmD